MTHVLQEAPDLTKHAPAWLQHLGLLGYLVPAAVWLYRRLRQGVKAEGDERSAEVEKAVKPYRERAEEAEHLAQTRKEQRDEERQKNGDCEGRVKRLSEQLEQERESKDRLQTKVMEMQGRMDRVEDRLDAVERKG